MSRFINGVKKGLCVIFAVSVLISSGCESKKIEPDPYQVYMYPMPANLALTSQTADNVYIGELLSCDAFEDAQNDFFSFTVKVEKVFRGNFKSGETVTDRVHIGVYNLVNNNIGKRFVLCTGHSLEEDSPYRMKHPVVDIDAVYMKREMVENGSYIGGHIGFWADSSPFIVGLINDDGTVSWSSYEDSDGETIQPVVNTDKNGSMLKSLYLELSDSLALKNELRQLGEKNITGIRVVNSPWNELYNVSNETEAEFVEKLIAEEEGYWVNLGGTDYEFSVEEAHNSAKTEITEITDPDVLKKWADGFKQLTGSHTHYYASSFIQPKEEQETYKCPQGVTAYITVYVDDKPAKTLAYCIYDNVGLSYAYSLYDANSGNYMHCIYGNDSNTDFRALVDMLKEAN